MRLDTASSACSAQPAEGPLAVHVASSASAGLEKDFVISAANSLQALLCLSSLMSTEADDPAKVRVYAHLLEHRVQTLGRLICPMLWNAG